MATDEVRYRLDSPHVGLRGDQLVAEPAVELLVEERDAPTIRFSLQPRALAELAGLTRSNVTWPTSPQVMPRPRA